MDKEIKTAIDHLNFYKENDISPVNQDITNLKIHFERRNSLYRLLGLPPMLIKDKNILEVGPGSGHNSIVVASHKPRKYTLLEPNKTGVANINKLFQNLDFEHTPPHININKLEDYVPKELFDIVITEGWLGISDHERSMMKKVFNFIKPGGIFLITLASPTGSISNSLRRLLANLITMEVRSFKEKSKLLCDVFQSHLETMGDMSRISEDWVQDTLLNPGFMTISVTPEMFLRDLGDQLEIYNTYPSFHSEWRWYKSLHSENSNINNNILSSYFNNSHNFFDYKDVFLPRERDKNIELDNLALDLLRYLIDLEEHNKNLNRTKIIEIVTKIQRNLNDTSQKWCDGIEEVITLLTDEKISGQKISSMKSFNKIFGRELIYCSSIKK